MIVALLGQTASGKSQLALELAKRLDGEIINADAFQVYRDFPLATASPSDTEKKIVPHHLYNFIASKDPYDIARSKRMPEGFWKRFSRAIKRRSSSAGADSIFEAPSTITT